MNKILITTKGGLINIKTPILIVFIIFVLSACNNGTTASNKNIGFNYPVTPTVNATQNYFGTIVADPYQWLESTTAPNVLAWVNQQDIFTQNYFNGLTDYAYVEAQESLIYSTAATSDNLTTISKSIVKDKNNKYFYLRTHQFDNEGHRPAQSQTQVSIDNIIYSHGTNGDTVFLDVSSLYPGSSIQTKEIITFGNNAYMAVIISVNYSDLNTINVIDIGTAKVVYTINNAFNNVVAFDSGIFYVLPSQISNPLLSPYNYNQLNYLYLESINNSWQTQNIYAGGSDVLVSISTASESTLYFSTSLGDNNNLYSVNLAQPMSSWEPQLFIGDNYQSSFNFIVSESNGLILTTNSGATRLRLIQVESANTESSSWQNILPPLGSTDIVNNITLCSSKYIVDTIVNGTSQLSQYSESGAFEQPISLPGVGAVSGGYCYNESQFVFYYSNLVSPNQVITYNTLDGTENIDSPQVISGFNPSDYTMQEVFVPSTGGVTVSVFLAYKKSLILNGKNPAYIDVYGGFDLPLLPYFTKKAVFFLEQGGIYAVAQVRGGGEQGTSWYNEGRLYNKQNTYNDVIAVAEYLVSHQYTNAGMLAVGGRSNGGLTAAAVALQRPDLFKVAFPAVGVLDLLRYNLFTYGFSWYYDYGFSSIEPQFNNMFVFSPLQNVQKINYPAMYIQTGQEDTRVPPLHSYKFAATLQNVASGPNPYILDAVPNISHFPATYTQEEAAKTWTFLFYNMNIQLPN